MPHKIWTSRCIHVYMRRFNLCDFLSSTPSGSNVFIIKQTVSRFVTTSFILNFWCIVRYPKFSPDPKISFCMTLIMSFKFVKWCLLNKFCYLNRRCKYLRIKFIPWNLQEIPRFLNTKSHFEYSTLSVLPWIIHSNFKDQLWVKTDWNWGRQTEGITFSSELQSKAQISTRLIK